MPDESCRYCGGTLIDFSQCAECKRVISMICKYCRTKTTEQYHSECILGLNQASYFTKNTIKNLQSTSLA